MTRLRLLDQPLVTLVVAVAVATHVVVVVSLLYSKVTKAQASSHKPASDINLREENQKESSNFCLS